MYGGVPSLEVGASLTCSLYLHMWGISYARGKKEVVGRIRYTRIDPTGQAAYTVVSQRSMSCRERNCNY